MIGKNLAHYKILERVGGGAFAAVYLAMDTRTNSVVALKVLHPQYSYDEVFGKRFWREAKAIYEMSHQGTNNIVRFHEYGQTTYEGSHVYYLAMEYLQGQDLTSLLAQGPLPIDQMVAITTQVAQALALAYDKEIIHRDIKPGNIKVLPNGLVKLMDFGIAKAFEDGHQLTHINTIIGTPEYLAPEIWEGQPADIRADIYALGVVCYQMLTSRSPFYAEGSPAIMRMHLTHTPPPPQALRLDVPSWLDHVVRRMIARDRRQRYQTPAELLEALHRREAPSRLPSRWWVAGSAAAAVLLVAGLWFTVTSVAGVPGATAGQPPLTSPTVRSTDKPLPAGGTSTRTMVNILPPTSTAFSSIATATMPPSATATSVERPTASPSRTATRTATQPAVETPTPSPPTNTPLPPTNTPLPPTFTSVPSTTPVPAVVQAPSTATVAPNRYNTPILSTPSNGTALSFPVVFQWSWEGTLQADEYFDLRVWQPDQPHNGITWTRETSYRLTQPTNAMQGTFFWSVAVIRGRNGVKEADLSAEARPQQLTVAGGGGDSDSGRSSDGGGTPPRPEPSPTR